VTLLEGNAYKNHFYRKLNALWKSFEVSKSPNHLLVPSIFGSLIDGVGFNVSMDGQ